MRRRADHDDRALFDVGQEHVLLRLVEAVNLVDEEDGAPAPHLEPVPRAGDGVANLGDAAGRGVQRVEGRAGVLGDDAGERGLAGAGRAVEDDRHQPVGVEHPPE